MQLRVVSVFILCAVGSCCATFPFHLSFGLRRPQQPPHFFYNPGVRNFPQPQFDFFPRPLVPFPDYPPFGFDNPDIFNDPLFDPHFLQKLPFYAEAYNPIVPYVYRPPPLQRPIQRPFQSSMPDYSNFPKKPLYNLPPKVSTPNPIKDCPDMVNGPIVPPINGMGFEVIDRISEQPTTEYSIPEWTITTAKPMLSETVPIVSEGTNIPFVQPMLPEIISGVPEDTKIAFVQPMLPEIISGVLQDTKIPIVEPALPENAPEDLTDTKITSPETVLTAYIPEVLTDTKIIIPEPTTPEQILEVPGDNIIIPEPIAPEKNPEVSEDTKVIPTESVSLPEVQTVIVDLKVTSPDPITEEEAQKGNDTSEIATTESTELGEDPAENSEILTTETSPLQEESKITENLEAVTAEVITSQGEDTTEKSEIISTEAAILHETENITNKLPGNEESISNSILDEKEIV